MTDMGRAGRSQAATEARRYLAKPGGAPGAEGPLAARPYYRGSDKMIHYEMGNVVLNLLEVTGGWIWDGWVDYDGETHTVYPSVEDALVIAQAAWPKGWISTTYSRQREAAQPDLEGGELCR